MAIVFVSIVVADLKRRSLPLNRINLYILVLDRCKYRFDIYHLWQTRSFDGKNI